MGQQNAVRDTGTDTQAGAAGPPAGPVALDAMGGERMPEAAVVGALAAQRLGHPVVLVGDEARLREELRRHGGGLPRVHAPRGIRMD